MSPSVNENLSVGKRFQKSAHTRSTRVNIDIVEDRFIGIDGGASGDVVELFDDEPT